MIIEDVEATETVKKTEEEYEVKRELVSVDPGKKLRNVIIRETRSGSNKNGDYLIIFLDSVDGGHYMTFVSSDMTENKNVWGKQFIKQFLYLDDETGYYMVKPKFEDVPVYFGKQIIKDKQYHNLVWGFEDVVENEGSSNENADELLAEAVESGMTVFEAGSMLVEKLELKPAAALELAKKYYGE
jgi:hypothetical protein